MTRRILETRGRDQYVEWEDDYGHVHREWEYGSIQPCACGKKNLDQCKEVQVTTFSETYACGFVYRYTNHNNYKDNLIEVNGKRVK